MAEQKTKATDASVETFIGKIPDPVRKEDCRTLMRIFGKASGTEPKMWGSSIVGYGSYHYKYASGHEGESCLVGFASRKDLTLYIGLGSGSYESLLAKLGKHKTGKGCLYIRKLADVDLATLAKLVTTAAKDAKRRKGEVGEG